LAEFSICRGNAFLLTPRAGKTGIKMAISGTTKGKLSQMLKNRLVDFHGCLHNQQIHTSGAICIG
jgi:hypothetical protein